MTHRASSSLAFAAPCCAASVWLGASPAKAQTIDCAKPANAVQKSICTDADLKALEAKMTELYDVATMRARHARKYRAQAAPVIPPTV